MANFPMQDVPLVCKICNGKFVFTKQEQEFYILKGFEQAPIRCRNCRRLKRERQANQEQAQVQSLPQPDPRQEKFNRQWNKVQAKEVKRPVRTAKKNYPEEYRDVWEDDA